MLVQFGNNWIQKFLGLPNWIRSTGSSGRPCPIWQSEEFFSSSYFQIGQHVVLLHIQIALEIMK